MSINARLLEMSKLDKYYNTRSSDKHFKLLSEESTYLQMLKGEASIVEQPKVKIPVKHEGVLEVPEGKNVEDLGEDHFKGLIKRKGWERISKALINLKVWNKSRDPKLSSWADNMQEKLAKWVEGQRESGAMKEQVFLSESESQAESLEFADEDIMREWSKDFLDEISISVAVKGSQKLAKKAAKLKKARLTPGLTGKAIKAGKRPVRMGRL